jgi:hypothetical protein
MAVIEKLVRNFTETDIDDEIVIMRLDNGDLFALSDTAAAIWRLIDGHRDRRALVVALTTEYAAGEQQILQEVDDLVAQLKEARLVAEG